jgi:hypothetical protein
VQNAFAQSTNSRERPVVDALTRTGSNARIRLMDHGVFGIAAAMQHQP